MYFKSKDKVSNIVSELRKEKRMTQLQLANELKVARQTIVSIEKGNYIPSVLLAFQISEFFNLPIERIFKHEKN